MESICPKCSKYENCRSPCYPVKQFLAENNLSVYEKTVTKENGETISIIFARSREIPQTGLEQKHTGEPARKSLEIFSSENDSPFSSFRPQLKQTGIFVDRFFQNFSYDDLAVKYDMTADTARKTYHNAINRVLAVLEAMDQGTKTRKMDQYIKQIEQRSGSLPKGQKWYLLNKLIGLRPSEIAEMEGLDKKSSSVRQLIIRVKKGVIKASQSMNMSKLYWKASPDP